MTIKRVIFVFKLSSHGFHILDLGTKRMLLLFSLIATTPFVVISMYFNKPSQTTFVLGWEYNLQAP